ncbi:hypothetical protein [Paraburkholderia hayleyella]|uniref:hypothetical protein n=1 Tax=Paraburkholderia hayleyella TaxID=2152889 RepID=UPI0012909401|nr:hypothetical protein [Paraburkholderia hayleyella]
MAVSESAANAAASRETEKVNKGDKGDKNTKNKNLYPIEQHNGKNTVTIGDKQYEVVPEASPDHVRLKNVETDKYEPGNFMQKNKQVVKVGLEGGAPPQDLHSVLEQVSSGSIKEASKKSVATEWETERNKHPEIYQAANKEMLKLYDERNKPLDESVAQLLRKVPQELAPLANDSEKLNTVYSYLSNPKSPPLNQPLNSNELAYLGAAARMRNIEKLRLTEKNNFDDLNREYRKIQGGQASEAFSYLQAIPIARAGQGGSGVNGFCFSASAAAQIVNQSPKDFPGRSFAEKMNNLFDKTADTKGDGKTSSRLTDWLLDFTKNQQIGLKLNNKGYMDSQKMKGGGVVKGPDRFNEGTYETSWDRIGEAAKSNLKNGETLFLSVPNHEISISRHSLPYTMQNSYVVVDADHGVFKLDGSRRLQKFFQTLAPRYYHPEDVTKFSDRTVTLRKFQPGLIEKTVGKDGYTLPQVLRGEWHKSPATAAQAPQPSTSGTVG